MREPDFDDSLLHPAALKNSRHEGRLYAEPDQPYRTPFQRDRDRIIHSRAFRRLGYKTQVFVNSEGDNYRTRLTHSIEVSQVARSVAAALQLNRDFAECLALAHDLGHPPFGHAGQDALQRLMHESGGFEHNCQSLRIVSRLEERYLEFEGLNLCRATLKGMLKHGRIYDCDGHLSEIVQERAQEAPALEAALVDLCDQITYTYHDLDDGLDAGLLDPEEVRELSAWKEQEEGLRQNSGFATARSRVRHRVVLRQLLGFWIRDLTENTRSRLQALDVKSLAEVYSLERSLHPVGPSDEARAGLQEIRKFLFQKLYRHRDVVKMSRRGEHILAALFAEYMARPEMLSERAQQQWPLVGKERVVCDYIAGMTDRFALKEYNYLFGAGS